MRFSIIIPSCNNGEWIGKTLDSILNQTFKDYEIIVVDDLSSDNSVDICKSKLRPQDTLIINESKRMNGGTRNVGILRAKGEYILCIDSDDWLVDNKVLEDIDRKLNGEDILFIGYVAHRKDGDLLMPVKFKNYDEILKNIIVAIWTKVVKTDLLKSTLFPEGTLFEDRIQHYRLMLKHPTYNYLGREAIVWNRTNKNTISGNMTYLWNTYRFSYCGELYRLINEIEDGDFKNFLKRELNGYMTQIRDMVDKL